MNLSGQGFYAYPGELQMINGHRLAPDIGAWIFNRGSGAVVNDLTPNQRRGTMGAHTSWKCKAATDGGGWCLSPIINGNQDEYVTLPTWKNFALPVTITSIVKGPAIDANTKGIYCTTNYNGIYSGVWVAIVSDNTVFASIGDGTGSTGSDRRSRNSALALTANKLYVITCVFGAAGTADAINIYINGTLSNGATSGTGGAIGWYTADGGGRIAFGPQGLSGLHYTNDIYAVFVYNRALTASDAAYAATDPYAAFRPVGTTEAFNSGILSAAAPRTLAAATIF